MLEALVEPLTRSDPHSVASLQGPEHRGHLHEVGAGAYDVEDGERVGARAALMLAPPGTHTPWR